MATFFRFAFGGPRYKYAELQGARAARPKSEHPAELGQAPEKEAGAELGSASTSTALVKRKQPLPVPCQVDCCSGSASAVYRGRAVCTQCLERLRGS